MVVGGAFTTHGEADAVLQWSDNAVADTFEADVNTGDFRVLHQLRSELANQFKPLFVIGQQFRPAFAAFDFDTAAFLGDGIEKFRFDSSAWAADRIVARGTRFSSRGGSRPLARYLLLRRSGFGSCGPGGCKLGFC